jgi:hypothetical protein
MAASERKKLTIVEKVKIIQEVEKNPSTPAIDEEEAVQEESVPTLGEAVQALEVV